MKKIKAIIVLIYNFLFWKIKEPFLKCLSNSLKQIRDFLYKKQILLNPKQKGWLIALKQLNKKENLIILETGRSRNPDWRGSDGNSTYFFSGLKRIIQMYSVDNDSENYSNYSSSEEYCRKYLKAKQLRKITFINGDSAMEIPKLPVETTIDIAFLDSANNPELILKEYIAIAPFLNKNEALVIVDDVSNEGKKGDLLIPYLKKNGYKEHRVNASPNDFSYFLIFDMDILNK